VALADVHGDYRALCAALIAAGLLDVETGGWCGGDTMLVQLGDILDRGDSEVECWELLQRLKEEAPASGGGVVCLVGNHELMNVAGRAGPFLHPRGHACFGENRAAAWRQGGPLATALADCPVIAIVGDSAFVHAHLPAGATRDGIERLNDEMRDWLLDPLAPPPRWIWGGDDSPVWDRSLSVPSGGEPTASSCAALRASLESLGVSRVIVGHTPQEQINCACSGAVWRCDTGMSRWVVGGPCEALEITPEGDVRVLGGRRAAAAAVAPPAGQKLTAPDSECDADGCEISFYDVM